MEDPVKVPSRGQRAAEKGISLFTALGVAIAVQISWGINHSIPWAIWHGLLNWFYVIYRWIVGTG